MTDTEPQSTPQSTQRILAGRYAIGEFIGQGGMATVYRGTDTKLGRQVAIKVMRANLADDEAFRQRFRQEAQSASRLAHPSVVRVLDAGDDLIQTASGAQRLPFIVMEYVDGKNLRELTADERLSHGEACRVVESVLTALEYSHRAGIIHRDIKTANIMITKTGQVKVMDFGIARAVSETSSTVQQTTAILGTAAYFSPEQAKGESVDTRTDLYSTGVLLYELLTGDVPFRGETAVAVAYQHVSERPQLPSERDPAVTAPLDSVLMHALAKDRSRRFQTAAEFRDALRIAASGSMPDIAHAAEAHSPVLFADSEGGSQSDIALRRLSESSTTVRTTSRPPVLWVWAAILVVIAVVAGVIFWLTALAPRTFAPTNMREIPDLISVEKETGVQELREQDLIPIVSELTDAAIETGHIIRTDPRPGARVTSESTVRVFVSTGPAAPKVPAPARQSLEQYTESLEALGLSVGMVTQEDSANEPANMVLGVTPAVGSEIPRGTVVDLRVSSGMVTVPDITGQSLKAAVAILEGQRLAVSPQPAECAEQRENFVIQQSIVGQHPQGSEISISYCAGIDQ